jgi:hypothetical protein
VGKETNVARLTRERNEALEQQAATSEVLQVISSSPGELQTVFDTVLAKAAELCEASYGTMWLREGDGFRFAALHGALPPAWQRRSGTVFQPGPDTTLARIAQTRYKLPTCVNLGATSLASRLLSLVSMTPASGPWFPCRCSRKVS